MAGSSLANISKTLREPFFINSLTSARFRRAAAAFANAACRSANEICGGAPIAELNRFVRGLREFLALLDADRQRQ